MIAARALAVGAGIWLMVSPAALGYVGTAAETSDRIVGPIAAAATFVAMWQVVRSLRWVGVAVGLYCLAGPWLLGFPVAAAVSNVFAGVTLVATGVVSGSNDERFAGGWRGVLDPGAAWSDAEVDGDRGGAEE